VFFSGRTLNALKGLGIDLSLDEQTWLLWTADLSKLVDFRKNLSHHFSQRKPYLAIKGLHSIYKA
jgi:hypothetical protein